MKVLRVEPRDIYAVIEFSLEQLKQIRDFLDNSTVTFNSEKDILLTKAVKYVTEEYYPELSKLIETVENEG